MTPLKFMYISVTHNSHIWSIRLSVGVSLIGMGMCGIILWDKIVFIKFCVRS